MGESIALLLQKHFIEYCRKEIGDAWQDCRITYFKYESLDELRQIFREQKGNFDGFMTSGAVPMSAVREVDGPPSAVIGLFGGYLENTYRILLTEILRRERVDARRIGIDYVEVGTDLRQVLEEDRLPGLVRDFEKKLKGLSVRELQCLEESIAKNYREHCREGRLDFVVTYFHSVAEALRQEGVDCRYSYPSRQSLQESIELCLKNIHLEKIRGGMSAVIRVSPSPALHGGAGLELAMLNVKSSLLEYCKNQRADPVMKDDFGDVEMYLNLEQVRSMTGDYQAFDLPLWLRDRTQFEGWISIGTGEDLNRARYRALEARDYERKLGKEAVVLIDEEGKVRTLPLKQKRQRNGEPDGIPASYVETLANRAHLSSETVFRVIAAVQEQKSQEITAYDLVRLQNFSLRVATRVLTALSEAGLAERVGQKRIGNKGRPQNLYRIGIPCAEQEIRE